MSIDLTLEFGFEAPKLRAILFSNSIQSSRILQ